MKSLLLTSLAALAAAKMAAAGAGAAAATAADRVCRSRGRYLAPQDFAYETCALCYVYMPPSEFAESMETVKEPAAAAEGNSSSEEGRGSGSNGSAVAAADATSTAAAAGARSINAKFRRGAMLPARPEGVDVTWLRPPPNLLKENPEDPPLLVSPIVTVLFALSGTPQGRNFWAFSLQIDAFDRARNLRRGSSPLLSHSHSHSLSSLSFSLNTLLHYIEALLTYTPWHTLRESAIFQSVAWMRKQLLSCGSGSSSFSGTLLA